MNWYIMDWFLQLCKPPKKNRTYHDEFHKQMNDVYRIHHKMVLDANIIGDTLSVAREKLKQLKLIIEPSFIGGVEQSQEEYLKRFGIYITIRK